MEAFSCASCVALGVTRRASEAVTYGLATVVVVPCVRGMDEMGGKSMVEFMVARKGDQRSLDVVREDWHWGGPMVENPRVSDNVNAVDASLVKME